MPRTRKQSGSDIACIGNGLYCRTTRRESLLDAHRRKQATCKHPQRDPKGMCYDCGQIENKEEKR